MFKRSSPWLKKPKAKPADARPFRRADPAEPSGEPNPGPRVEQSDRGPTDPDVITEPAKTAPPTPQAKENGRSGPARQPPKVAYISFSAEINPNTTEALIALVAQQVNAGVPELYLMLSTPGGSVMNGLNLYNFLRAIPAGLTTHNSGNVDSIGNAVFLAGQRRYACPHSTFTFHGVGFDVRSQGRFEEKHLREGLQSILADQKRIGSILVERTNLKTGEIGELFKETRTKDADYARRVGIVHDIRDLAIPSGAPIFSLVFQR
jgi:ATP-dependent protease ClpP protease subunit